MKQKEPTITLRKVINEEMMKEYCKTQYMSMEYWFDELQTRYVILKKQDTDDYIPKVDYKGDIIIYNKNTIKMYIENKKLQSSDIIMNALGWYKQTEKAETYKLEEFANIETLRSFAVNQIKMPFLDFIDALKDMYVVITSHLWRDNSYTPCTFGSDYPMFYQKNMIFYYILNNSIKNSSIIMNAYEWYRLTVKDE